VADGGLRAVRIAGCGAFDKAVSSESFAFATGAATHVLIGFSIVFFLTIGHSDPRVLWLTGIAIGQ
jgi:hypothetical protein